MSDPRGAPESVQYWRTRLAQHVDLCTTGWQRLGLPFNRALYRQRMRVLRRTLRGAGVSLSGARVLEVAPGTGIYLAEWFAQGAREVHAVDVSSRACEAVRTRFPRAQVTCADWTTVDPTAWGMFDVVTAFDVLFHLTDPAEHRAAVLNLGQACRPGGWVLFSDTLPRSPVPMGGHSRLYTAQEYADRLAEAGLRLVRTAPIFVCGHPWLEGAWEAGRRMFNGVWFMQEAVLARAPWLGYPAGLIGEALDAVLTRVVAHGPSQKLVLCRREGPAEPPVAPSTGAR